MRYWFIRKFVGDNEMIREGISGTAITRFFHSRRSMSVVMLAGVMILAQAGCGVSYATENQLTPGQPFRDELASGGQGPEMVVIPAGRFRMGCVSGRDCEDDEMPVHEVRITQPFAMSKYEVTRGEFGRFVAQAGYRTMAERGRGCYVWDISGGTYKSSARWNNPGFNQSDTHPVVCVSWDDAVAYVEWLSSETGVRYRLPSEAEWEYAARSGSTTKYHFGDDESQLCRYANHQDRSTDLPGRNELCSDGVGELTAEVGSYQPNGFGLHDMHGNVGEWVQDCGNGSYAGAPSDGSAWTGGDCGSRVWRGGSWVSDPGILRSANRYWLTSDERDIFNGFRVARMLAVETVTPEPAASDGATVEAGLGLTRAELRQVQQGLTAAGFNPGSVDGLFSEGTRNALRDWQASQGKAATGYLDVESAKTLLDLGSELEPIQLFKDELGSGGQGPEMLVIPAGRFRMGCVSGRDCKDDEMPVHEVRIAQPFALSKYEVTRGEFGRFVVRTGYRTTAERGGGCYAWDGSEVTKKPSARWNNPGFNQSDTHPVVCVSWNDAVAYVEWLSSETGVRYRLPSEAEWEYAARSGSPTKYHFGDDESQLCRYANHRDRSTNSSRRNELCSDGVGERTAEVGSYRPNDFGLHDMHGNVWEWVQDCWNDSYVGAPSDGSAWKRGDCGKRVLRGGSWIGRPWFLRAAYRLRDSSVDGYIIIGFRVARTLAVETVTSEPAASDGAAVEAGLGLTRAERRQVQQGLTAAGFSPELADGLFGEGTRSALREWQASQGEAATGYLDAESARILLALGSELESGRLFRDELGLGGQGPEMVVIPAGRFRMGCVSGRDCWDEEMPEHEVGIAESFALSKYEVTRGEFGRFVAQAGYRTTAERGGSCSVGGSSEGMWWNNPGFNQSDTHPVVCVSWDDAVAYLEWLSSETGVRYRLPSEAEWEYAARAGTTTKYHFGNDESQLCRYANHGDRSIDLLFWRNESCSDGVGRRTAKVGSYRPNDFGLYDMHGNVSEWVQDCWNESYAGAPSDGSVWTSGDCGWRVFRGGSWLDTPWVLRTAFRYGFTTGYRSDIIGFRVARTLTP